MQKQYSISLIYWIPNKVGWCIVPSVINRWVDIASSLLTAAFGSSGRYRQWKFSNLTADSRLVQIATYVSVKNTRNLKGNSYFKGNFCGYISWNVTIGSWSREGQLLSHEILVKIDLRRLKHMVSFFQAVVVLLYMLTLTSVKYCSTICSFDSQLSISN